MSSTYSPNLALELIGTGDQAGAWGSTTNTNLGTLIEQAISGYVTQAVVAGTDTTITIPNGATGVARNMFIELTGTGGTNTNLIVPANKKLYFIYNNSTGAVTVKVSGQTGVSVPAAAKILLVCNGTDIVLATNYMVTPTLTSPTMTGTPVAPTASPGTNTTQVATTAFVTGAVSTATGSLGTMSTQNANNVAITGGSISGITDLAVADGGTGVSTLTGLAYGNGTSAFTAASAAQVVAVIGSTAVTNATNATNATTAATVSTTVASGATGTTQSNGDNTTKMATTAYVQNMGLGWGQTWQNLTSSRALGSSNTYTNNTGKPIQVSVTTVISGSAGDRGVRLYVDSVLVAYNGSFVGNNAGTTYQFATAIVPNGATYYADTTGIGGSLENWAELR